VIEIDDGGFLRHLPGVGVDLCDDHPSCSPDSLGILQLKTRNGGSGLYGAGGPIREFLAIYPAFA
jgi:hypothetical protein